MKYAIITLFAAALFASCKQQDSIYATTPVQPVTDSSYLNATYLGETHYMTGISPKLSGRIYTSANGPAIQLQEYSLDYTMSLSTYKGDGEFLGSYNTYSNSGDRAGSGHIGGEFYDGANLQQYTIIPDSSTLTCTRYDDRYFGGNFHLYLVSTDGNLITPVTGDFLIKR